MFDLSKLNKSSFRGIEFFTDETTLTSGKRLTDHNFINGGNRNEDNGLKNKTFKIKAYIGGDDYLDKKQSLIDAFDLLGSGVLIDKFYGNLEVNVETYTIKEGRTKFGKAELDITFKKVENKLIQEDLIVFNVDYKPEVLDNFRNDFNNEIGEVLLNRSANKIGKFLKTIGDTIKFLEDERDDLNNLKSVIGRAISEIKTTILSIDSLTTEISDISSSFDEVLDFELFGVDDQKNLTNTIRENLITTTSINIAEQTTNNQVNTYILALTATLVQSSINNLENIEFSTGDDFGIVKDDILIMLSILEENVVVDNNAPIDVIIAKQNLLNKYHEARKEFILFYTQKYSRLQSLQPETIVSTIDVLNLTMEKYGDITRVNEVLINNDIIDPLFINGDLKLLEK